MEKTFCVYSLATRKNGPLDAGATNDLGRRVWEHKRHVVRGCTARCNVDRLVYFKVHDTAEAAIAREKRVERRRREWTCALVEQSNPEWRVRAASLLP